MAAWTLAAMSAGIVASPWSFFACSAPLAITSATSLPSMTKLQPGIRSPHRRTFAMMVLLLERVEGLAGGSRLRARLPETEYRAGRILDHGEPAEARDLGLVHENGGAEGFGLGGRRRHV